LVEVPTQDPVEALILDRVEWLAKSPRAP